MGKRKNLNTSVDSEVSVGTASTSAASTRAKRRRNTSAAINQNQSASSLNNTSLANYSNLQLDLETNEIVLKLESNDTQDRLICVEQLGRVFADPDSDIFDENPSLWTKYLRRFNDSDRQVRMQMLHDCVEIFRRRPDSRDEITEAIGHRIRDPEEEVRHEAVTAIATIANADYSLLSDKFLDDLKDRVLDKKYKVRHETLLTLASFYRRAHRAKDSNEMRRLSWIKNKLLHIFYQCGIEDKIICEKLTYSTLVNYLLPTNERMDELFELYCTLDENALKAFNGILRQQLSMRVHVRAILDMNTKPEAERNEQDYAVRIRNLGDRFPNPAKAAEQLKEFFDSVCSDHETLGFMRFIAGDAFTCGEIMTALKDLFNKFGTGSQLGQLHATPRSLLERTAPVIIDGDSVQYLIQKALGAMGGTVQLENVEYDVLTERAFKLLTAVSFAYPGAFKGKQMTEYLLTFLEWHGNSLAADTGLKIFSHCVEAEPNFFPDEIMEKVVEVFRKVILTGTPRQAKHAAICLAHVPKRVEIFEDMIPGLKAELTLRSAPVLSAIAVFRVLAMKLPAEFKKELTIVGRILVQEIVLNEDFTPTIGEPEHWHDIEDLSLHAKAKVAAIKFLPRWVLGQRSTNDTSYATKSISLLCAVIDTRGDVRRNERLSYAEKASIRLAAAQSLLKLFQEKPLVPLLSMVHARTLAKLIVDDCRYIRERFTFKLHTALISMKLPLEYLAIFCYAPLLGTFTNEDDKVVDAYKTQIQSYISDNVARRRGFLVRNPTMQCRPEEYLPEYYMSYVVYLLSFYDRLSTYEDLDALEDIKECLWFALEPILPHGHQEPAMEKYQFLHKMFQDIKQTRNVEKPTDEQQNKKLWAICDMAIVLLSQRIPYLVVRDATYQSLLSKKCFTSPMKTHSNTDVYLRKEFLNETQKEPLKDLDRSVRNKSRNE